MIIFCVELTLIAYFSVFIQLDFLSCFLNMEKCMLSFILYMQFYFVALVFLICFMFLIRFGVK